MPGCLPPLAYSFPSFCPEDYDQYLSVLEQLRSYGFRWVTFTPAYQVKERIPAGSALDYLEIDATRTPALETIRAAVLHAVKLGFHVKLEPHLDWETTLQGELIDWRRRIYLRPDSAGYAKIVIEPLAEILSEAARTDPGSCFILTLGSEIDVSLLEFAEGTGGWSALLARLQHRRAICRLDQPLRLAFGQKINHDTLEWSDALWDSLNQERGLRSGPPVKPEEHSAKIDSVYRYLNNLDHVSVSFYPRMDFRKSDGHIADLSWWMEPASEAHIRAVAATFQGKFRQISQVLKQAIGDDASLTIGEFGLGSIDVSHPYKVKPETFTNRRGTMEQPERELRRKYYLGFLSFLRSNPELFQVRNEACFPLNPVTFWTVSYFDFMDALSQKYRVRENDDAAETFKDELLIEEVMKYNRETND
jgi:hypothetical protein